MDKQLIDLTYKLVAETEILHDHVRWYEYYKTCGDIKNMMKSKQALLKQLVAINETTHQLTNLEV